MNNEIELEYLRNISLIIEHTEKQHENLPMNKCVSDHIREMKEMLGNLKFIR